MSVRAKVLVELTAVGVLTTVFLLLFPRRNPLLDVALAGFALLLIAVSAPYTRKVIWGATPSPVAENRVCKSISATLWFTVPGSILFFLIGGILAFRNGGWPAVSARIFTWRVPVAFACYLPWALMQQTLLQFYLLGRLLVLFPNKLWILPFVLTGACFGLVHLPDIWTAMVTVVAGAIWSFLYYRYRMLLPLAFSHAVLGTSFYYGIFGHDLAVEWRSLLP